ncbi:hypothetical protein [Candidatus Phytoplasma solani]|uniref:Uncharacterized protein n=1 Tax=Candidatus Phytoplasma solani TaxID=69896 RepID=A0A421NUV7_9MOLU|nr:hypothetical protein [Candidatus Phytoplasma solani]RMI87782.1 hypothetical protein PSSA1_v1c5510 [Candidatus Phytoplasma solani]
MNDLNFTIGFLIGCLFTTALMFLFKKLFFSLFQHSQPQETKEIKKRLQELESNKHSNNKIQTNIPINPKQKPIELNNKEIEKE